MVVEKLGGNEQTTTKVEYPIVLRRNHMQFNQYQQLAERTANRGPEDTAERMFTNFAFGLAGETGEVIDCLKKHLFHGHPLDREKLKIELGDLLWYIATTATTADISLYEIASANIAKLKARYPEGFSEERSIHREDNT
jgi:NTP pyrophosphatase (non-canonical NTP hydrolase)